MKKKIWIDLETTGINHEIDTIIEFAAICDGQEFHEYCLPSEKPNNWDFIEQLTGITWSFLVNNGIEEKKLFAKLDDFLCSLVDRFDKTDKLIFSGYRVNFDNNFVRSLFVRNHNKFFGSYFFNIMLDVGTIVAELLSSGGLQPLENYKLKTICNYYNIDFNAHSAIEDIRATKKLYEIIMEKVHEQAIQG